MLGLCSLTVSFSFDTLETFSFGAGVEASIIVSTGSWEKFKELLPLQSLRGLSLHLKEKICAAYTHGMACESKMWAFKRGRQVYKLTYFKHLNMNV